MRDEQLSILRHRSELLGWLLPRVGETLRRSGLTWEEAAPFCQSLEGLAREMRRVVDELEMIGADSDVVALAGKVSALYGKLAATAVERLRELGGAIRTS
jgi:hypothetical protein